MSQFTDIELREAFNKYDKDNSGSISCSELQGLLTDLGLKMSYNDIESLLEQYDKHFSHTLDFEEFKVFVEDIYSKQK